MIKVIFSYDIITGIKKERGWTRLAPTQIKPVLKVKCSPKR